MTSTSVPSCSHGPANRFTRSDKGGNQREFFACSAVRDRKECALFHWVDDWQKKLNKRPISDVNVPDDHMVRMKLSRSSALGESFMANAESKSASQFFFDETTLKDVLKIISDINPKRLLCLGAPTVYRSVSCEAVLLDIDYRLPDAIKHNMFTNHFFNKSDEEKIQQMSFDLVICDPPFQPALLPKLAETIKSLAPHASILIAFPYFQRHPLLQAIPALKMTDMRLSYENHRKYKGDASPVRLFATSIDLKLQNYKWCDICQRSVHSANKHCFDCGTCTTLHGLVPYRHCADCKICVKPKWRHCKPCKRCKPQQHVCGQAAEESD